MSSLSCQFWVGMSLIYGLASWLLGSCIDRSLGPWFNIKKKIYIIYILQCYLKNLITTKGDLQ